MVDRGTPLIEVFNLKKSYETPTGMLPILKGVQFEIYAREMTFIVGRSGSGKSTLLHLLSGLDHPSAGRILLEGNDLVKMNEKELAEVRRTRIGLVFQFYHLLPELTLFENVWLPSMIEGKLDKKWAKEVLKRVKLWSRRDHYPSELSGGEQQRAAIARALVNRPSLVLCDEPTGNLDEETAEEVFSLMENLNRQDGQSFLVVTHDEGWAWRYQNVLRLHDGVLIKGNRGEMAVENVQ